VCPSNLPDGTTVRLERSLSTLRRLLLTLLLLLLLLGEIVSHTADLQEAFAVTRGDLSAIVIELTVINVILMLSVDWERCGAWVRSLSFSYSVWDGTCATGLCCADEG